LGSRRRRRSSFRVHRPSPRTVRYSVAVAVHRNRTVDDHQYRNLAGLASPVSTATLLSFCPLDLDPRA
jgi:hypothetical protein